MAIDWTRIPPASLVGCTGTVEYRIENDGLVRWRGDLLQMLALGAAYFPVPAQAQPIMNPHYLDWTGIPADHNLFYANGIMYINMYGEAGSTQSFSMLAWVGTPLPDPYSEHSLPNIMSGLADALREIAGLRVYDFPSERIQAPAAVLSLPQTPYDVTLGGRNDEWTFPVWVFVSKANDKAAYAEMLPYLDSTGTKSIRAALEVDRTLGGACDTAAVVQAQPQIVSIAGTEFLAVEFTLEVFG